MLDVTCFLSQDKMGGWGRDGPRPTSPSLVITYVSDGEEIAQDPQVLPLWSSTLVITGESYLGS